MSILLSTGLFATEIVNGEYSVSFNTRTQIFSGGCSTFTDGDVVGISSSDNIQFVHEVEVDQDVFTLSDDYTFYERFRSVSAKGFCASQTLLSALDVVFTKTPNVVSIAYTYRCNRKEIVKTISCSKK